MNDAALFWSIMNVWQSLAARFHSKPILTLPILTQIPADVLQSSVKQRKVEEHNLQLIQQLLQERTRRQMLQLGWASLENTLKLICPPLADARCHLVFTATPSLFKVDHLVCRPPSTLLAILYGYAPPGTVQLVFGTYRLCY